MLSDIDIDKLITVSKCDIFYCVIRQLCHFSLYHRVIEPFFTVSSSYCAIFHCAIVQFTVPSSDNVIFTVPLANVIIFHCAIFQHWTIFQCAHPLEEKSFH